MIGRAKHLGDDQLVEGYLAEQAGEPLAAPIASHLAECPACHARRLSLAETFDLVRSEGDAAADEIFTPSHLDNQREQILRRIERLAHPAHVLNFPGRTGIAVHPAAATRIAPRWLVAAAAAGLLVGVAVGSHAWIRTPGASTTMTVASAPSSRGVVPAPTRLVVAPSSDADADDDVFLSELELSLDHMHTRELQPFDLLTPRVQEIGSVVP